MAAAGPARPAAGGVHGVHDRARRGPAERAAGRTGGAAGRGDRGPRAGAGPLAGQAGLRLAIDGGVLVSDEAVRVLFEGRDPYQASYAQVLADWRIDVEGRPADNPLIGHYPYWPGSLALLAAVEAPCAPSATTPTPGCCTCWSTAPWGCGWAAGACANVAATWGWPWPSASTRCSSPTCGRTPTTSCWWPARPRPRLVGHRRHHGAGGGDGGSVPSLAPRRLPHRRRRLPPRHGVRRLSHRRSRAAGTAAARRGPDRPVRPVTALGDRPARGRGPGRGRLVGVVPATAFALAALVPVRPPGAA